MAAWSVVARCICSACLISLCLAGSEMMYFEAGNILPLGQVNRCFFVFFSLFRCSCFFLHVTTTYVHPFLFDLWPCHDIFLSEQYNISFPDWQHSCCSTRKTLMHFSKRVSRSIPFLIVSGSSPLTNTRIYSEVPLNVVRKLDSDQLNALIIKNEYM